LFFVLRSQNLNSDLFPNDTFVQGAEEAEAEADVTGGQTARQVNRPEIHTFICLVNGGRKYLTSLWRCCRGARTPWAIVLQTPAADQTKRRWLFVLTCTQLRAICSCNFGSMCNRGEQDEAEPKDEENGGGDDEDDVAENQMQEAGDDKGRGGTSQQVFCVVWFCSRYAISLIYVTEWTSAAQQEFERC
jgi:hypothetical protein